MRLTIEVSSRQVNCGIPQRPESSDTTGRSFHSFTIVHDLIGNNDSFVAQMYEALVRLTDGDSCTIATSRTRELDAVIWLTVEDAVMVSMTGMAVQMEYEQLVRVTGAQLPAVPAVS